MNTHFKSTAPRLSPFTGRDKGSLIALHDLSPADYAAQRERELDALPFTVRWQREAVRVWPYVLTLIALAWLFACLVLGGLGTPAGAVTATFYTDHTARPCANGATFAANTRRYHGLFGASNHYRLGTRLLVSSRSGRRVIITIADRGGPGIGLDMAPAAFRRLAGKHWHKIGRVTVQARRAGR